MIDTAKNKSLFFYPKPLKKQILSLKKIGHISIHKGLRIQPSH